MNIVSRLCSHLRDTALEFNFPFDMCRCLVEGEDLEIVHEVLVKHHRLLTNKAFIEAVRIAAATIAQASAEGSQ